MGDNENIRGITMYMYVCYNLSFCRSRWYENSIIVILLFSLHEVLEAWNSCFMIILNHNLTPKTFQNTFFNTGYEQTWGELL